MTAAHSNFNGAAHRVLPLNFIEIDALGFGWVLKVAALTLFGWEYFALAIEEAHRVVEAANGEDGHTFDERRLVG